MSDQIKIKWIYLSDELILGNLTNETKKDAIRHFHNRILLKGDFQEGIDYKEIKKDDGLVINYLFIKKPSN